MEKKELMHLWSETIKNTTFLALSGQKRQSNERN